ncbi:MAG: ABC transporter ATP-binding protein, partial [Clostridia bacterium]|nr:ABC transporter ATP-binding protein [Clostridia bacterium]
MIELKNVTKKFGLNTAVNNISVKFDDGEIIGFLGPNGAGKSTTMNMMTGYISTTSGSIEINGYDILKDADKAKKLIGYLPENPPLYMDMTVLEYLKFVYELKKVKLNKVGHINEIMELVKISNVKNRIIKNLSKGYKQRVGIAQALIGNPEVLILDEPTVGLDPNQIQDMRSLIRDLGKDRTVIISSHILSEITSVCSKVLIINNGKLVVYDTIKNINEQLVNQSIYVAKIMGVKDIVVNAINNIPDVKTISVEPTGDADTFIYTITPKEGKDIRKQILDVVDSK